MHPCASDASVRERCVRAREMRPRTHHSHGDASLGRGPSLGHGRTARTVPPRAGVGGGGQVGAGLCRGGQPRPRRRSMSRRSRFVGRPAPRSRTASGTASSRGIGGGLWSMTASAASAAETRLTSTFSTTSTLSWGPPRTTTRSPVLTFVAGLARSPLTRTWPALTPAVAWDRLLYTRTAHSQLSTRALAAVPPAAPPVPLVVMLRAYESRGAALPRRDHGTAR